MSTSFFDVLLAAMPPLVVLVLMVGFRWGGDRAGITGWIVAVVLAVIRFGAGLDVLFYAHIRGLVFTIDVVYIVWAALLLYMVVNHAGGLKVIAAWFTQLTGDSLLRVLLLGWVLTSFLQGVGGFGVPVAIVAPLLVGLGLSPVAAVVIPSIGHAWAVTFGSLGSSFIAMLAVTGLESSLLGPPTALLLGIAAFGSGILISYVYNGWHGVRHGLPAALFIGAVMAVAQFVTVGVGLWNIGATIGGLAGLAAGLWVTRWSIYRRRDDPLPPVNEPLPEASDPKSDRKTPSFVTAIAGYMILVVLAILITGVEPVKDFVGQVKIAVDVPETETARGWVTEATDNLGIRIFAHTGAVLVYSALIAFAIFQRQGCYQTGAKRAIARGVKKGGGKAAVGILSMVVMATVMANAGMTRTLAEWLAGAVPGALYPVVGTMIGGLGAFMTGSNTNSNAVFSVLQQDTAVLLGISVPLTLAVQNASAAITSIFSPAKIMVGASTVGLGGNEGVVLRHLLLYGGLLLLLMIVVGLMLQQMGAY